MREINTSIITKAIKEMCIEANLDLSADMREALKKAYDTEQNEVGKHILSQLDENLQIAEKEQIPICQDTGMAVIFISIGQDVHFTGELLSDAVNEGVRQGYEEGYLRKSIVEDPLIRNNTKDNTPAIIHYDMVKGDKVEITVAPKGFGSENMSRIFMLKPSDGEEGIKKAVITAVTDAGANACPPMVIGVGLGGDFEKSAILAKKALTGKLNSEEGKKEHIVKLQKELLGELNMLNIGPGGLGGNNSVLGINIETYPTHIAGMPLAVNICCHVNRHKTRII